LGLLLGCDVDVGRGARTARVVVHIRRTARAAVIVVRAAAGAIGARAAGGGFRRAAGSLTALRRAGADLGFSLLGAGRAAAALGYRAPVGTSAGACPCLRLGAFRSRCAGFQAALIGRRGLPGRPGAALAGLVRLARLCAALAGCPDRRASAAGRDRRAIRAGRTRAASGIVIAARGRLVATRRRLRTGGCGATGGSPRRGARTIIALSVGDGRKGRAAEHENGNGKTEKMRFGHDELLSIGWMFNSSFPPRLLATMVQNRSDLSRCNMRSGLAVALSVDAIRDLAK